MNIGSATRNLLQRSRTTMNTNKRAKIDSRKLSSGYTARDLPAITDWNDEYNNIDHTPGAAEYFDEWPKEGWAFRNSDLVRRYYSEFNKPYDPDPRCNERHKYDLFKPYPNVNGLFIFVHGGYWYKCDNSFFLQLSEGPMKKSWAVAMPKYTLCPNATISEITKEITMAVNSIVKNPQLPPDIPMVLCGHSAGGHLVTRQICGAQGSDKLSNLNQSVLDRLKCVISISGVHDLRPIVRTNHNDTIRLTEQEAWAESPALLQPMGGIPVVCLVGTKERPEFIRQTELLANIWRGMGVPTTTIHVEGKHHFDIIDDLKDPEGLICRYLE